MKRLIPAAIILVFIITICFVANIYVNQNCDLTLENIKKYQNNEISSSKLESIWQEQKEKMALFVNHGFLDKITIYIGQLSAKENKAELDVVYQNIESVIKLIKAEQDFALHSFY
ncbi:MAG: DUF4363 family protein [Clostridia bacterium]|nr:DUF4363 family protein [Clostridia bacterium]